MGRKRTCFSVIVFCILAVAGSALAFAVVVAGASVALADHQASQAEDLQGTEPTPEIPGTDRTFNGMITDSHCGARHMRNTSQNSIGCARACVRKGAAYVLVSGSRRYTLVGGETTLAELAGQRANITGTRQGDTILVDAAAPVF